MATRSEVIAEARLWLGTPFHHQGRLRGVGCDCIGLVVGVCRALGLGDADARGYARTPDGRSLAEGLARHLAEIPPEAARPGDVLLLRIRRDPQHVGFLGPGGSIIHAYAGAGRVVETRFDSWWQARLVAAYAIPGVEDD